MAKSPKDDIKKAAEESAAEVGDYLQKDKQNATLHLNRKHYKKMQQLFGRNVSKVVDDLIENLLRNMGELDED